MARKYQLHGAFPSKAGDSAYEIAKKNGFEGTEEEWLASLKGKDAKDVDLSGYIESPKTTSVGQTIVVKEVDENGKPILWEAADFPVSGAANDNPLELISDITLEEDVDIIIIEQDDNGEPFELENFMLETRVRSSVEGTSTGGVNGHVTIGKQMLQNCNHAGQQDAVFNVNTMYRIFNSGLVVFRVSSTGAGSMIAPTVCKELLLEPTIKKITLKNATANVRYLAGSSIKLYGRRVKK